MNARLNQYKNLLYFVFPIFFVLGLYFFYPVSRTPFFTPSSDVVVSSYDDHNTGGNSTIRLIKTDSSHIFKYKIGNKLQFPYAGIRVKKKTGETIDLSPYNEIRFRIRSDKARLIPINLSLNDYPLANDKKGVIILHTKLQYYPGKEWYTLSMENFEVPSWWLVINKITEAELNAIDFKAINSIDIQCGELIAQDVRDEIELLKITFRHNPKALIKYISIVILVLDLIAFLIYLFRLKYTVKLVPVLYKGKEIENLGDSDIHKIQTYISEKYHEQITVSTIQVETGIPKSRIPTLIKSHLNTTLKQLLISIRLTEAKRLLKESDLPVNGIADQVGFGHVSHFNRVFKDVEGKTPLEFRKSVVSSSLN